MGVTIHFEGQLTSEQAYQELVELASSIAKSEGWGTELIGSDEVTLLRVRDEKDCDYTGPVKGIAVFLHDDCDPVRFEFDKDLYVQEFTKTQFAGPEYHLKVINLLRTVQPLFRNLKVDDEGEFWDTGDRAVLQDHFETIEKMIADMLKENPSARLKVKERDGKIIDIIT
jgi:hypothetical protein